MNHGSAVRLLLDDENLGMILYREFRKLVDTVGKFIVRRVTVDRNRNLDEALDAIKRAQCADHVVVDRMLIGGGGDKLEVVLFKPKPDEYTGPGFMSDADMTKAVKRRELYDNLLAVVAANEADPALAEQYPHYAHEKDSEGNLRYLTFSGCRVYAGSCNDAYVHDRLWLAGVRRPAHARQEGQWFS